MTLRRQTPTLDRVRDDHGGTGVVDLCVRLSQSVEVVATEIADGLEHRDVVEVVDQRRDRVGVRRVAGQSQTYLVGRASQQTLILRIRHVQDSFAQRGAARPGEQ